MKQYFQNVFKSFGQFCGSVMGKSYVSNISKIVEKIDVIVPDIYDMSFVDGNLNTWIENNRQPSDAKYTRKGEIVTILGKLPNPARRII